MAHPTPLLLVSAFALATALPAQFDSPAIRTATAYGVTAIAGDRDHASVPGGTAIEAPLILIARAGAIGGFPPTPEAYAGTFVLPFASGDARGANVSASAAVRHPGVGDARRAGTSGAIADDRLGAHILELVFDLEPGAEGLVELTFTGQRRITGSNDASAVMDVTIDDGSGIETRSFTAQLHPTSRERTVPVRVAGDGGLAVHVTTRASVAASFQGAASFDIGVLALFRPRHDGEPRCTVTPIGSSCAGGGTFRGHEVSSSPNGALVEFSLLGLRPFAPAIIVVGTLDLQLELPGGCRLLTDPLIADLTRADLTGEVWFRAPVPAGLRARAQIVSRPFDVSTTFQTSNALGIVCR